MTTLLLMLWACAPKTDEPVATAETAATSPGLPSPDTRLPRTPDLVEGTLSNGLDWYIRPNSEPSSRAELRLIVRAGSVYEDDDQQGLAHLLEHMAFNGTASFGEDELVATLESLGMEFGAHTNAYTSTDETVYKLRVPTDDPVAMDTAFTVLGEWSHAMTLAEDAIERERGVVLEEWRRSRGVGGRIRDATWPVFWDGSRYAHRRPIGTEESLKTFEPDALRRFYRDWYRPEKMAVVAVGDFDVADIQSRIEQTFGGLNRSEHVRPDPDLSAPDRPDHVVIVADPEIPGTGAELDLRLDSTEDDTYGGYRARLVDSLALGAMLERCRILGLSDDPPFLGCGGARQRVTPWHEVEILGVGTQDELLMEGLEALLVELERFRRHGLTQGELDRRKAATLSHFEGMANESEATPSRRLAEELVRVATTGESVPGIAHEYDIVQATLPTITLEEISAVTATFLAPGHRHVEIIMPARDGLTVPTEEQVLALMAEVATRDIAPPVERVVDGPLVETLPEPGSITARRTIERMGVEVWTLSNGAEVWLKPTDFKADEVLFEAWSPGGRAMTPDEHYLWASSSLGIQGRSGLGTWSASDLTLRLQGTRAGMSSRMERYAEGLRGSAAPEFLEEMFQLAWLRMTAPRFEEAALKTWRDLKLAQVRNRLNKPDVVLDDAYKALMWDNHLRMAPWTEAELAHLDLVGSERFYRERFGHAGDFTFILVGAFELAQVEPLVVRYLASLPADGTDDTPVQDGALRADGALEDTAYAGIEEKARLKWRFHGPFENTSDNRVAIASTANVLEVLLREELREKRGGTYSVSVRTSYQMIPQEYTFTIDFQCDPARLDELEQAAEEVIRKLQSDGVAQEKVAAEQAINHRNHETYLESNSYWRKSIRNARKRNQDLEDLIYGFDARNDGLSPELIQATASWVMDFDRYVKVRLLPASMAPGE